MKYLILCTFCLFLAKDKLQKPRLYDTYLFYESPRRQIYLNIISDSTLRIRNLTHFEGYDFDNLQRYKVLNDSMLYVISLDRNEMEPYQKKKYYTDLSFKFKYSGEFYETTPAQRRANKKTEKRIQRALKNKELFFPTLHLDTIFIRKNGLQLQYKEFLFRKHSEAELFEE